MHLKVEVGQLVVVGLKLEEVKLRKVVGVRLKLELEEVELEKRQLLQLLS